MNYTVAKTEQGRWVHLIKYARTVEFSTEPDWFFVCTDWEKPVYKREDWRWISARTRFEQVREIIGAAS